ncbi:hypothetical protein RND81_09G192600 [Saponaria officinalis]|uniref:RING-CH-type domain-containing protein n=1 Tax=Saponaria officinalis TaxID=3572 RepID=A0AAW1IPM3_SAPOF
MEISVIHLIDDVVVDDNNNNNCETHQISTDLQIEDTDESTSGRHSRRPNLSPLEIPARAVGHDVASTIRTDNPTLPSPFSVRAGLPPRPCSAGFRSSMRNMLPQRNQSTKSTSEDGEKAVLIFSGMPKSEFPSEKPCTSRSFSLKHVFSSPSTKRACSLPVTPLANSDSKPEPDRNVTVIIDHQNTSNQDALLPMKRSFSVPVKLKNPSLKRLGSTGGVIRVVPVTPHVEEYISSENDAAVSDNENEEASEDIPEEEAVCRICLVELSEGGDALKLECSCKGELALAHKECAVKWFTIKGNKICDVCQQDVKNLPVTLLRVQSRPMQRRSSTIQEQAEATSYRVWQDIPILVILSMLAYFCFLEQLLVSDLGPRALAVSLPSSCVLGVLSSIIASTMVSKGYIWAYASFQFSIVVLFAHIFYTLLKVNALLSILLSSFTGFGIAISTNALIVEYLRWRASSGRLSSQHPVNRSRHPQQHHRNHHHRHVHQTRQHSVHVVELSMDPVHQFGHESRVQHT